MGRSFAFSGRLWVHINSNVGYSARISTQKAFKENFEKILMVCLPSVVREKEIKKLEQEGKLLPYHTSTAELNFPDENYFNKTSFEAIVNSDLNAVVIFCKDKKIFLPKYLNLFYENNLQVMKQEDKNAFFAAAFSNFYFYQDMFEKKPKVKQAFLNFVMNIREKQKAVLKTNFSPTEIERKRTQNYDILFRLIDEDFYKKCLKKYQKPIFETHQLYLNDLEKVSLFKSNAFSQKLFLDFAIGADIENYTYFRKDFMENHFQLFKDTMENINPKPKPDFFIKITQCNDEVQQYIFDKYGSSIYQNINEVTAMSVKKDSIKYEVYRIDDAIKLSAFILKFSDFKGNQEERINFLDKIVNKMIDVAIYVHQDDYYVPELHKINNKSSGLVKLAVSVFKHLQKQDVDFIFEKIYNNMADYKGVPEHSNKAIKAIGEMELVYKKYEVEFLKVLANKSKPIKTL